MITLEKLKLYDKYAGDIDHLQRVDNKYEKKLIEDDDWLLISELIQDIGLIKRKLTSENYEKTVMEKMPKYLDDRITISELEKLSEKYFGGNKANT